MEQGEKRKLEYPNTDNKRAKSEETKPSGFENELANFDPIVSPKLKWRRPPLAALNPSKDAVVFQQLDLDHYIGMVIRLNVVWEFTVSCNTT